MVTAIAVKGLTKNFKDLAAVNSISFEVEKGEIFGFLGPNGAGKTTTINMLIGLLTMTEGSVNVLGFDLAKEKNRLQSNIGVVPDESNLYPEMTGFQNLTFCGSLYGMAKKEQEKTASDLLKRFELSDVKDKPFKAYSKGMKRKLTIAAAMMHRPAVLFLDEPSSGIDVASARQIRNMIEELNRQGTTIFLTTHYLEEAERLCHRIAFIVNGKIARIGTVETLKASLQEREALLLSLDKPAADYIKLLEKAMPNIKIHAVKTHTLKIMAPGQHDLAPLINFFQQHNCKVFEARRIEPSMEEVFVHITGIEEQTKTRGN